MRIKKALKKALKATSCPIESIYNIQNSPEHTNGDCACSTVLTLAKTCKLPQWQQYPSRYLQKLQNGSCRLFPLQKLNHCHKQQKTKNPLFETLLACQSDMVIQLDAKGNIQYCNPSFHNFFSHTPKQFVGNSIYTLMDDENIHILRNFFGELSTPPYHCTVHLHLLETSPAAHILWEGKALLTEDEQIAGFVCIGKNISQQKTLENIIKTSDDYFLEFIENTQCGILIIQNEIIKKSNSQVETLLGFGKNTMQGQSLHDMIPKEQVSSILKAHQRHMDGEIQTDSDTIEFIRHDFSLIAIELTISPLLYQGSLASIISCKECHAGSISEENLEMHHMLKNVFEQANEGICIIQNGKIKTANRQLAKIVDLPISEIINTHFLKFIACEQKEVVLNYYRQRSLGETSIKEYNSKIINGAGETRDIEINSGLIEFHGKPATFVFIRDITEKKIAETKIQQSLSEKNVLLKEIHHRVKNNMQIISSLISLQMHYIKNSEIKTLLNASRNRIKSMALIHEELYFASNLSQINLSRYIRQFIPQLTRSYSTLDQQIKIQLDLDEIIVDINTAIPFGLLVHEIISNSIKFAFPSHQIDQPHIQIHLHSQEGGYLELTIKDNGIGYQFNTDSENSNHLGLKLIQLLAEEQLDGHLNISTQNGTYIQIIFHSGDQVIGQEQQTYKEHHLIN